MKAPIEYGSSKDPAPTYAPASAPTPSGYSDSSDPFGGAAGPNQSVLNAAISLQFIAPSPVYSPSPAQSSPAQSSPVAQPSSPSASVVAASPVSAPASIQPQIARPTTSATQSKGTQMAGQVSGTITQASPLRVIVDGATVDSPANVLNGATYILDDRVMVQLRNPQIPVVMGVIS